MDRNTILALGLAGIIILGWELLVLGPQREAIQEAQREAALEAAETAEAAPDGFIADLEAPVMGGMLDRSQALAQSPGRVRIDTPTITGSLNLRGATLDDVSLKDYLTSTDENAPLVNVLSPRETNTATYLRTGLIVDGQGDDQAVWTAPAGATLTPTNPVTLTRSEGSIEHQLTISVDDAYMFTAEHSVVNNGSDRAAVLPYGFAVQKGIPDDLKNFMILFEGPLGVAGGELHSRKYKKLNNAKNTIEESGTGGWAGITDKYWLAAAIPPQDSSFELKLTKVDSARTPTYRSSYQLDGFFIEPGQQATVTSRMFAGAKVVETLQAYEDDLSIVDFDKAVDWGMFFFLTRPISTRCTSLRC
ncbi:MAG: membrane protein insertase YidC [Pseudomonadota bacterium]